MRMKSRLISACVLGVCLLFAGGLKAQDNAAADAKAEAKAMAQIKNMLYGALGGREVLSIGRSELDGFYSAQLEGGESVLIAEDGEHFVVGDLFGLTSKRRGIEVRNISELQRAQWRKERMDRVSKRDLLVFSPRTKPKTHVNIFTDVDCGYCRKLHQEMAEINRYGIEVRYLAFPRAGVGSPTYNKMVTAWCANSAKRTLTDLKSGRNVPTKLCVNNPVSKQYELGKELGVRGTPAIFTADGELVPGYLPAEELAKRVGVR